MHLFVPFLMHFYLPIFIHIGFLVTSRISIDYYKDNLAKLDKKLLTILHDAYEILHLSGYYEGIYDAEIVKKGFDKAIIIIDKIKPHPVSKN